MEKTKTEVIHKPTPIIKTKRLILRPFLIDDALAMFNNWACDEEVTKYLNWLPHQSIEQTQLIIKSWIDKKKESKDFYQWAICLKETNEPIGSITCFESTEIGYCISKRYWHQGITSEAFKAIQEFLFKDLGLESIFAVHNINNPNAGAVMKKCGMQYHSDITCVNNKNEPIIQSYYIMKNPYLK